MDAEQFRCYALELPEAEEQSHMNHPDFRIRGKIFATLGPEQDWGMVKLTAEQQAAKMTSEPDAYRPASGAWGERGATIVQLQSADEASVRHSLILAWRNTAPKRLIREYDGEVQ